MSLKKTFTQKWAYILIVVIICFAGMQLIRPTVENPPVTLDIGAPPEVEQVLRKSCYDCHSNETNLAWFDKITPANFLVAGHIRDGRAVLNFSEWDSLTKDQQKGKLFESLNQVVFAVMPLKDYTRFHHAAVITGEDMTVLKNYVASLIHPITVDTAKERAADDQYTKWITFPTVTSDVKPELNGLAFLPDYKNWKAISSTDRMDNGTMRVILGNDVAVRAIAEKHTNPWPDGSSFAKVAWDQLIDTAGRVRTGAFKQVEFMVKGKEKYAGTDGWGFGRWVKGTQLVPYGKNVLFATECTNCHQPMHDNDFFFTPPIDPRDGKVITSGIDKRNHTMFTLYGNGAAADSARAGSDAYPAGSLLTLVTWVQKEDPHWFGADIPGGVLSVEKVTIPASGGRRPEPAYEFTGTAPGSASDRLAYILGQKASVMP